MHPDLDRLADELCAKHHAHTVILYGSRARGNARPTSDLDVFVLRDDGPATSDHRRWEGLQYGPRSIQRGASPRVRRCVVNSEEASASAQGASRGRHRVGALVPPGWTAVIPTEREPGLRVPVR